MSRILIRLVGGLGNQMFQYAAARALALRSGKCVELDLSWFGTNPERQYALGPFATNANIHNYPLMRNNDSRLLARVIRRLGLTYAPEGIPSFREASFRYDPRIEKVNPPVILDGYFQSEKYFLAYRSQMSAEFTVQHPPSLAASLLLDKIAAADAICLHIRRADYVSNPKANAYHGTCSMEYYREGLEYVSKSLGKPHCFVFSDEPYWVRENFKSDLPTTIVDIHRPEQAHEDLRLMVACKHYVIANSSMSWWGAWLSANAGKKVVAPLRWFKNSANDTSDLIPSEWHRL